MSAYHNNGYKVQTSTIESTNNNIFVYSNTAELVEQLSEPPIGSKDLHFQIRFPQTGWGQYKACLWKQHLSYWRNPGYNLVRLIFMVLLAIIVGVLFWQKGKSM